MGFRKWTVIGHRYARLLLLLFSIQHLDSRTLVVAVATNLDLLVLLVTRFLCVRISARSTLERLVSQRLRVSVYSRPLAQRHFFRARFGSCRQSVVNF